ncbi:FAD-dependent oxidoreductase [Sphingomonas sp. 1P06PA]|uniref:NAD(P)/FAD-dependent oxidoreductase n=1 Tax=Sphingomonas sp. 1P06PA TaxID=554121 RepID=UPI0039A7423D
MIRTEIAIVGAGMAGASLAAELAAHAQVLLIEAEGQPGYHSTGRSAAFWSETYGGPAIQPLTTASEAPLRDGGYLAPRGALHIARAGSVDRLAALRAEFEGTGVRLDPVDRAGLEAIVPGLRPDWTAGLSEPSCADIDVARLHADCLAAARRAGAQLLADAEVRSLAREPGGWRIETRAGAVIADIVVNAAGAWAGAVAALAGAAPIAITPYRRTIVQLAVDPPAPAALPLVIDIDEQLYFKPEAGGRLWLSPHDESEQPAADAQPEELDVAIAIDRLEQAVDWRILKRERAWAGLRSFSPDRAPVYGFDARAPGFFWCAGQGGFGIQTAPAAALLAAALLLGKSLPDTLAGVDAERYAPGRFG